MALLPIRPHEETFMITRSRLDISCLIERGEPVPVLFEKRDYLMAWANRSGLDIRILDGGEGLDAVRAVGLYPLESGRVLSPVDFVWVRTAWRGYRKAMAERSFGFSDSDEALTRAYHADHVVARSRLKRVPESWSLIFEVPAQANTVFGAKIERRLVPIEPGFRRYDLTGMELLKIFGETMPLGTMPIDEMIERVRGQFLPKNVHAQAFLDRMEQEIRSVLDGVVIS